MNKQKLSQQTWFTILMIFVFFPVGLYLMWKNKKFNKVARIVITASFAIFILTPTGDNSGSQTNITNDNQIVSSDILEESDEDITPTENISEQDVEETSETSGTKETVNTKETISEQTTPTPSPETVSKVNSKTFDFNDNSYKIIEVDGGNLSGTRQSNVAVDIGYGDRVYWGLTNEYGQLIYVIADKVVVQDDDEEPVNSDGRYYDDEAKVPGTEQDNLDEGHVIADSLGGVSNAYNITPQDSTLNRHGDQAYMEKVIRDAGGCQNFVATITYPNTTTQIPSHYHYEYVLNGEKVTDDFDNVNPDEVNATITSTSEKETNTGNLTDEKEDITKIDTNGNGTVTIAEAKAAGYSMPITKDDWLYKYMNDNDGDGMVGE